MKNGIDFIPFDNVDKCRKVADIKIDEGAGIKNFSGRFCFMATGNNVAVTVSVTQGNC